MITTRVLWIFCWQFRLRIRFLLVFVGNFPGFVVGCCWVFVSDYFWLVCCYTALVVKIGLNIMNFQLLWRRRLATHILAQQENQFERSMVHSVLLWSIYDSLMISTGSCCTHPPPKHQSLSRSSNSSLFWMETFLAANISCCQPLNLPCQHDTHFPPATTHTLPFWLTPKHAPSDTTLRFLLAQLSGTGNKHPQN